MKTPRRTSERLNTVAVRASWTPSLSSVHLDTMTIFPQIWCAQFLDVTVGTGASTLLFYFRPFNTGQHEVYKLFPLKMHHQDVFF